MKKQLVGTLQAEMGKITNTILITMLMVVFVLMGAVTAVFAHEVELLKSTPASGEFLDESPPEVRAWFSEEMVSGESWLSVVNNEGVQVDNGDGGVDLNDPDHASMIVTLPPLPDGSYAVQWHATLLDGDATEGAFSFAVGTGQPVIATAAPAAAAEGSSSGLSGGMIAALVAGLVVLVLIGGIVLRRRQS